MSLDAGLFLAVFIAGALAALGARALLAAIRGLRHTPPPADPFQPFSERGR